MFTVFVCLFLGGIVSEYVQSLLPVRPLSFLLTFNSHICFSAKYKTFQFGDVVVRSPSHDPLPSLLTSYEKANLLGSGIGLYVAYHLERYYRQRREVRPHCLPSGKEVTSLRNITTDHEALSSPFRIQLVPQSPL